ncbi:MAG: pentapeptide repeat-containing protein, partial [Planctomycetota bacterium]
SETKFYKCDLSGANFSGAKLDHSHFDGCNLDSVTFSKSTLEGAVIQNCSMARVDLTRASTLGITLRKNANAAAGMLETQNKIDALTGEEIGALLASLLGLTLRITSESRKYSFELYVVEKRDGTTRIRMAFLGNKGITYHYFDCLGSGLLWAFESRANETWDFARIEYSADGSKPPSKKIMRKIAEQLERFYRDAMLPE